jgi:hypothetical protein
VRSHDAPAASINGTLSASRTSYGCGIYRYAVSCHDASVGTGDGSASRLYRLLPLLVGLVLTGLIGSNVSAVASQPSRVVVGASGPVPVGFRLIATSGVVAAGSSARYSMGCPAATPHPIGGQFNSLGPAAQDHLALSASYPVGRRSWVLEVTNLGSAPQGYRAFVACGGARGAKFAYLHATSVIAPGQTRGVLATCPRDAASSLGGLFYLRGGTPANEAVVNWIELLYKRGRLTSSATAGLRSIAGAPVHYTAGVVCSNLQIAVRQRTLSLSAGQVRGAEISCPPGGFAVSGTFVGAERDTSDISLAGSEFDSARQYTVRVRSLSTQSQRYMAGVVCVANYLTTAG